MNIDITKKKETPLLSRTRVTGFVTYTGPTPSRIDIRKELSKQLKVNEGLIVIKHVYSRFGLQKSKVIANIYGDEKQMSKLEHKNLLAKHSGEKPKKEEKAEEKPAEEKKEEKAEEKKEEKPEEAKEEKPAEEKKEEKPEEKKEEVKEEK
jgi:ribosomal protein S24E